MCSCDSNNFIKRLFPLTCDNSVINKLKIDDESIYYISIREIAETITNITLKCTNIDGKSLIITDTTAGVGGNTLSFANKVKHVNSIEIDKIRYDYLCNNIQAYNITNVTTYNDDFINIVKNLNHHVIFIDPPWGGRGYKHHSKLKLQISNINIEDICNMLFSNNIMSCVPLCVIIKLPKNYDLEYFHNHVKFKITVHELQKMYILTIKLHQESNR